MSHTADVVIVGAGIIGGSIAFHLLERDPRLRVVMLEKEAEPGTGATSKATGGVRFQFSTEANVRLTQLGYRYFTHAEEVLGSPVDFLRHGYLFVTTDPATLEQCRRNVALQRSLGVPSELLGPEAIQRHLACLVTRDLVGGTFCADDGSADPYSMLQAFLARARARGLQLLTDHPVVGLLREGDRVTGVRTPQGEWSAPRVIDCAGPHADQIGAMAGVEIPSKPYRRQVMVTEPLPVLPEVFPLIVDLDTGFYVHRQGRSAVLMGGTDKDIKPGLDTEVDWEAFDAVFRAAAVRVPPLAEAKVMRAYAGVRDLTPDYHGILGPAAAAPGLYVACGFSGHGFMHAPAIGILMSEILLDGRATSMDVAALSLDRFAAGRLRAEANMF
ncbi:MAG TPA: FAD-dependent oxidoreductase [Methylomirabilota bacterium]|nr:FAD-dependent oxidoreductase [Methylomirabilota bacterium]